MCNNLTLLCENGLLELKPGLGLGKPRIKTCAGLSARALVQHGQLPGFKSSRTEKKKDLRRKRGAMTPAEPGTDQWDPPSPKPYPVKPEVTAAEAAFRATQREARKAPTHSASTQGTKQASSQWSSTGELAFPTSRGKAVC